jgi:DNA-binding GntR family transcriptional regulator
MTIPNYFLDLDRSLPQTMHEQAVDAIIAAIQSERAGFCVGDRLITQELSRQNSIHRNTLSNVMSELVRLGYFRRLPNKGFEVVQLAPERPSLLTRHILSLTEVAQRDDIDSKSQIIAAETGVRAVSDLQGNLTRVSRDLVLDAQDRVSVLTRCRLMKQHNAADWDMVAIEQSFISTTLVPDLLENTVEQIQQEGDSSVYRQLHRIFPNEDFFKAHYEISLSPLPKNLAANWMGKTNCLIAVVSITYCSQGPVEMTYTWFDASKATLTAGSLDVKLAGLPETS